MIRNILDFIMQYIELAEIVRVLDVVQVVVEILLGFEHDWGAFMGAWGDFKFF